MGQSAEELIVKTEEILWKKQLEHLYLIEKLSDDQIAKQHHLTLGQVHRLRNKYKIRTMEQYERHPVNKMTDEEVSIIIGKLLGNGHMRRRKGKQTYPQLMIEHSVKQKEYVYWLRKKLDNWIFNKDLPIKTNRKEKNGKFYHSLSFQTVCHPVFSEIHKEFYKSGKKVLSRKLLEKHFNLLAFAVWVMDDGFLSGKCRRIGISTNNFTLEEVKYLKDFLARRFELKSWVCRRTNTREITWELHFDRKSSIILSMMIKELVIDSMKYKLLSETTKGAGFRP